MHLRLLLILSGLLAGCATGGGDTAPSCDGRDRRPANPHGSILQPTPPPAQSGASTVPDDTPTAGGCA